MDEKLTLTAQRLHETLDMIDWLSSDESDDDKPAYRGTIKKRIADAVIALLDTADFLSITARG